MPGEKTQPNAKITIPYIADVADRIKSAFRSLDITTHFTSLDTFIKRKIRKEKKQSNLVYGIAKG